MANNEKEQKMSNPPKEPQKAQPKVQLPRILILVIVMPWVLLMVGFGFFLVGQKMFSSSGQTVVNKQSATTPAASKPGVCYAMKDFVVNLKSPADRHLKVSLALQLTQGSKVDDIKSYEPKIRYLVIANLRNETIQQLSSTNGLERLRYKLKSVINQVVPGNKVYDLLITDFIYD